MSINKEGIELSDINLRAYSSTKIPKGKWTKPRLTVRSALTTGPIELAWLQLEGVTLKWENMSELMI